jgi:hypothetical protein
MDDLHGLVVGLNMASNDDMQWLHPTLSSNIHTTEESIKYCFAAEETHETVYRP